MSLIDALRSRAVGDGAELVGVRASCGAGAGAGAAPVGDGAAALLSPTLPVAAGAGGALMGVEDVCEVVGGELTMLSLADGVAMCSGA
jgi:hypothetical protein